MALLLFYLLLALGVSFLCSLAEAVILSLPRSKVALLLKQGRPAGRILDGMKRNIDRPLAAILTLNTIAHTVGAAGVGGQSLTLARQHGLDGEYWVALSSGLLTLLILVLSEIIPKTIGAVYAGRLATVTAYLVQGMIIISYPIVVALQALARVLSGHKQGGLTREEVALIAELGTEEGAIHHKEYRIIHNLLHLNRIRVHEIMTPRTVASMLSQDMTVRELVEQAGPLRFARTPIFADGPDQLVGLVLRHEVYEAHQAGEGEKRLADLAHDIHAVPETASVRRVLNEFVIRRAHMFQVVDEYGGTAGIVTLEDAIETLLGEEIIDETDTVADMRQLAERMLWTKMPPTRRG